MTAIDPITQDRFVVARRRRYTLTPTLDRVELSEFSVAETDEPICHVRQPVSRFNEGIRFYADAAGIPEVMRIKARPRFDPWARYQVTDPSRETIGEIERPSARGRCAPATCSTAARERRSRRSAGRRRSAPAAASPAAWGSPAWPGCWASAA
jgi:hypothetical protein